MNEDDQSGFSLADIRAIRWLVLATGVIAIVMLVFTDRESPLMVIGFVSIVTVVPVAAIFLLRRLARKSRPPNSSRQPGRHDRP